MPERARGHFTRSSHARDSAKVARVTGDPGRVGTFNFFPSTFRPSKLPASLRFFLSIPFLSHSFARTENSTSLFSSDPALLAKNTWRWGYSTSLSGEQNETTIDVSVTDEPR